MFRKIKRVLSLALCAFLLMTLLPQVQLRAAAVTQGTCGENVSWSFENGTLTISGSGQMYDYSTVESAPWFDYYLQITNVVLKNGMTNIGNYAFWGYSNLTDVTMSDSVTVIGEGAFSDCDSLTNVTMSDSVTDIGSGAFYNCSSLADITISESITSVSPSVFANCRGLTSITIPKNVTSLGGAMFFGCTGLTSVTFLGCAPIIDDYCFGNVQATVYYPCGDNTWTDSVKQSYGGTLTWKIQHSFDENGRCTVCQKGNVLYSGTCGSDVLWELDEFGTLHIIGSGEMDDYSTFESAPWYEYNSQIVNVVMEDGVYCIGSDAFKDCSNLTSITIPDSVKWIGSYAFYGCSSLTGLTIPNGVTDIGDAAFYNCSSLTGITIPDGVSWIYDKTFYGCSSLTSIIIPENVTRIEDEVFYGCSSLTSITIPDSVTGIEDELFYGCISLINVTLGDGVSYIGESAFHNCSSLTSITIGDSVTSIGSSAFSNCSSLTGITIGDSLTSIGDWTFSNCSSLTNITIPDSVTSIGMEAFSDCSSLTNIIIPDSVTSIGMEAFSNCSSLTSITIGDSLTSIGDFAFSDCRSLTRIIIPESVTSIGEGAFHNCSSLTLIPFLGAAPTIGTYSFFNVCATVYYRCSDETWTGFVNNGYGGTLTWKEYHTFGDDVIFKDATCEEDASVTETCLDCGIAVTTPMINTATGHRYKETVVLPTCTEEGFTNKICTNCGNTEVVDKVPVTGHSYEETVIPPTCTEDGSVTNTCANCGNSYSTSTPATGHRFVATEVEASCTGYGFRQYECETCHYCAYDNVSFPMGHSYEETVVPPSCTEEGSTLYTCTTCGDSYRSVIPAAGHRLLTTEVETSCIGHGFRRNVCEICGYTFYDNVTDPLGHHFENGSCITCGTDDPDHVKVSTIPTISLKYPSLSFEDVIIMNVYYTAEDLQDVVDIGLITCNEKPDVVSLETADAVIPGYYWSEGDGMYYSSTAGIAPKDIGDTIYFAVYARLFDGTVTYTNMIGYSPKTYALNQLTGGSSEMRPLVSAMLSYGAAAQNYFGYKTDDPMNNTMTDEQKALAAEYSDDMIATVTQASGDKLGTFINDKTFSARYTTITFEGAFCINYYFKPTEAVVGDVTMYVWSLEDFEAADVLTKENATCAVTMTLTDSGEYTAVIDGIAAKDLDKAVYVSFIYNDGTTEHCGGVVGYTIGMYCKTQAGKTGALSELAKACAVYGYYAKQLFS